MDAPGWNGDPPDDDPFGEHQDDGRCEYCGALADEECSPECECADCARKRLAQWEREFDEALGK